MPHFATERGCGQFAWLQGLLFSKPKPRKGGQGTMGPLRRFFGDFLSAGGKKVTRRRQDKVAARQGVRERQRRGQSPSLASARQPPLHKGALGVEECGNPTHLAGRSPFSVDQSSWMTARLPYSPLPSSSAVSQSPTWARTRRCLSESACTSVPEVASTGRVLLSA